MENRTQQLLKIFATILKKRSIEKSESKEISETLLKYFSRKELIAIIKYRFEGTTPKEFDLVEKENEELLRLIEDDMFIIAYTTRQWSLALKEKKVIKPVPPKTTPQKTSPVKTTTNGKTK